MSYCKQVSPSTDDPLPDEQFRLFAVCARFPENLQGRIPLTEIRAGVYEFETLLLPVRIIAIARLPQEPQNALLHLFSANEQLVRFGASRYRPQSEQTSQFLLQLFGRYHEEGLPMPFTLEEFNRQMAIKLANDPQIRQTIIGAAPVHERLEGIPVEEVLDNVSEEALREALRRREAAKKTS